MEKKSDFWKRFQKSLKKKKKSLLQPTCTCWQVEKADSFSSMAELHAHMSSPTQLKLGILFRGQLTRVKYTAQSKAMEWNQPAGPHWNANLGSSHWARQLVTCQHKRASAFTFISALWKGLEELGYLKVFANLWSDFNWEACIIVLSVFC